MFVNKSITTNFISSSDFSEQIIQESGCGKFQILLVLFVNILVKLPVVFSIMFMSFGIYHPGWRCADKDVGWIYDAKSINKTVLDVVNSTRILESSNVSKELNLAAVIYEDYKSPNTNESYNIKEMTNLSTDLTEIKFEKYSQSSCSVYGACHHIEFDPKVFTIVTEWGLACDKSWIPSFIISVQMGGIVLGNMISGHLGDTFGRKKILYGCIPLIGVINVCSIFSPNWETFAVMRFLLGCVLAAVMSLYILLPAEYLNSKWRAIMAAIPSWHVSGILFSIAAMLCKDWKMLHIITAVMCIICFLPVFWVPESLRWLGVKRRHHEFSVVVEKIEACNKTQLKHLINKGEKLQKEAHELGIDFSDNCNEKVKYTIRDLFRRSYCLNTIILGVLFLFTDVGYFGISYGITSLHGNIYVNFIIMFGMEIPFSFLTMNAPNLIGRRNGSFCFYLIATICMLLTAVLEIWADGEVKKIGTLIFALLARTSIHAAWFVLIVLVTEIYPTCVRSIGHGYAHMMSRVGGILAPFFIPSSPDTVYLSYLIMGLAGGIGCFLFLKLPETKGNKILETFTENANNEESRAEA